MLSYRVTLDVPFQLAVFVSGLLAEHRRELGTRDGTRALTCWKQAVFALAWFRDRPDIRRLGEGSGILQATAYRYKDEASVQWNIGENDTTWVSFIWRKVEVSAVRPSEKYGYFTCQRRPRMAGRYHGLEE